MLESKDFLKLYDDVLTKQVRLKQSVENIQKL